MLIDLSSPQWKDPPATPKAVTEFQRQIVCGLGGGWEVELLAYDDSDACNGPENVSASLKAKHPQNGVYVGISRHVGSDSVLVRFGDRGPFPFEDLAVATGIAEEDALIDLVKDAFNEAQPKPLVEFEAMLEALRRWGQRRPDFNDEHLDAIAEHVAIAFEKCAKEGG